MQSSMNLCMHGIEDCSRMRMSVDTHHFDIAVGVDHDISCALEPGDTTSASCGNGIEIEDELAWKHCSGAQDGDSKCSHF